MFRSLVPRLSGVILLVILACIVRLGAEETPSVVSYRGWGGALRASNEAIEIVVLPQTGRLVHLSRLGKENWFTFDESLAGKLPPAEEGDWLNYGGDWMWPVHQDHWEDMGGSEWPPLRVLDRAVWHSEVEVDEKGTTHIRLRRDVGEPVFIRVERHFELQSGPSAELKAGQTIRRIQASDVPVTLWQISQVSGVEEIFFGADPQDFEGEGYRYIKFKKDVGNFLSWCGEVLMYQVRQGGEHKIGTLGDWIAARKQDEVLFLSMEGGRGGGTYPDGGCKVVMYSNTGLGYNEIETQSEAVALAPGETLSNSVTYRLMEVDAEAAECVVAQTLASIAPVTEIVSFSPHKAHPGDRVRVKVRTDETGGVLHWGVNSPQGNWKIPDRVYWPEGSVLAENGKAVETPLPDPVDGLSVLELGPFNRPEQVVTSVHTVVRWGKIWESKEGENYNLTLTPHPEASALEWTPPENNLSAGKMYLGVGSEPPADELRLFLNNQEVAMVEGSELRYELDARDWSYGPHEVLVRAMRDGHLSTARKRVWKTPQLEKVASTGDEVPYGASKTTEGLWRVLLYGPSLKFVELEWRFEDGEPKRSLMHPTVDGHWVFEMDPGETGQFAYRYLVNGEAYFADPFSRDVLWETPAGKPSHLPEHAWTLVGSLPEAPGPWDAPDPSTWVIYELHIPDMSPPGSYQDLKARLEYIHSLGINAIEPLPVTAFPGVESWGYNPAFHMAIERSYGTPEDFKELILAARELGIAYVADLVLNHVDADAPLNRMFGEADQNPYTMPFAQFNWGFPKLDQESPALKRYIKDSLEQWVNYWGVDGFRYDATQWVKWSGYNDWGASWMSYVVDQANPDVIQIAENLPSEPNMVKGTELDSEWDGHYRWRMRKIFTEAKIEELEKVIEILDPRSHAYHNGFQRVPYIESHDEERFVRELLHKGYTAGEAFTRHHAAAAITLTVPGIPMLYAGQEWGEMTEKVVGTNPLQWQLKDQPARAEMLKKFRELINLRVQHRALHHDRIELLHLDQERGTVAYLRPGIPESILVAFNVSKDGALLDLKVDGIPLAEIHHSELEVDLSKLTLRPGQARIFRIFHPQETR